MESGRPSAWSVDRGDLVGTVGNKKDKGWLLTQQDYSDFELRLEFQFSPGANSGVALRVEPGEQGNHPEIQLMDDSGAAHATVASDMQTGALYKLAIDRPASLKPVGSWNQMTIELSGSHLRVRCEQSDHARH